jgi:hypothetical protein
MTYEITAAVVIYFWLSACVAIAAHTRGKYAANWLFLATFFSPLLAGALLFALPRPPFRADDVTNGVPYRRLPKGEIEIFMGGPVRLASIDLLKG